MTKLAMKTLGAWMMVAAAATSARAQTPDGAAVFTRACAACHDGAQGSRAPSLDALRLRSAQAVFDALLTGAMRMQGARLTGAERRAVVEYTTGKSLAAPPSDAGRGLCAAPAAFTIAPTSAGWSG